MEDNNLKNIVVIKNLPSNIVEEAIVVLKANKIKLPELEKKQEVKTKQKDYILKEAEMVISNYFSNMENKKNINNKKLNKIERKYKTLKFISIGLVIALITVIIL